MKTTVFLVASVVAVVGVVMMVGGAGPDDRGKADAAAPGVAGFLFKSVSVGEHALKYVEYVPRGLDVSKPRPLVVFLHGSGECGDDGQKQLGVGIGTELVWHAERWPCIVLIPQKPVQRAQWEEYDAAVMAMVEQAKKDNKIDVERISLTGLSQGGHGVWAIGMRHPEVWCALAPICGYSDMHGGGVRAEEIAAKVKSIPVWCFHGEKDPVVPASQSRAVVEAIRIAAKSADTTTLSVYPEVGHEAWNKAYGERDLPKFLMTARKK